MSEWLIIVGMALATYAIRLAPFLALERVTLPDKVVRALRFVPIAVFTAIVVPELVRPAGVLTLSLDNVRLIAGVIAFAVAWLTRNAIATLFVGMACLWLLTYFK